MQILTPAGTAAYAFCHRPQKAMEEGKPDQYSLTLIYEMDNPKLEKVREAIYAVAEAKWGSKARAMLDKGQLKSPLRDDKPGEDFEGKLALTARGTEKPQVVDADAEPLMDANDFYSGCRARMDVYFFAYEKKGNKGVSAILNNVQKLGDGERKSGRRSAQAAFADLPDDEADLM